MNTKSPQDIRWQQRFKNFQRAFLLLYAAKNLNDADTWLRMIGDRNLMSHTYDFSKFEAVIATLRSDYLPMLDTWYLNLLEELND
ncbi:MAG: nucleotidyltransferase substrate binding protein [Pseudohongiellaceae bacterium]